MCLVVRQSSIVRGEYCNDAKKREFQASKHFCELFYNEIYMLEKFHAFMSLYLS